MKIKMKVPALIVLMSLSLLACKKNSRVDDGIADVYVKSIIVNGQVEYGLVHFVLGYSAMSTVTVNLPDATSMPLLSADNSNTLFYSEPSISNGSFSLTPPLPGTYTYKVRFDDGVEKILTDQVDGTYILPPTITQIAKSTDGSSVMLRWDPVAGVEYYRFSISKNGTVLSNSQPFIRNAGDTYIEISTSFFSSYLAGTDNYTIELSAIKYQSIADGKIQSAGSASADIIL